MSIEPNGVCEWCDVPHGGHQVGCPARERDEALLAIYGVQEAEHAGLEALAREMADLRKRYPHEMTESMRRIATEIEDATFELGGESLDNLSAMAIDQGVTLDEMLGRVIEIAHQLWTDAQERKRAREAG